ncbi:hypothetical protein [Amycolatopsis sp. NBRC 101858]|uniref:hypothetical protein n=1 Tax=Amycolatopsis sp. NBRC 101858 TaxID=3032200 RepID=UPI002552A6F4|nr:hypothetical protein [Amycolatopsis sp. NBRC 101858]
MDSSVNILVGLVVLAWLVWRQTQRRLVREDRRPVVLLILLVLGVLQLSTYLKTASTSAMLIVALVVSLLLAAGFGVVRARSTRLWRKDGQLWRQGTWVTAALWVVGLGVHIGLDLLFDSAAKGLGAGSILLYLAVSLGVQRLVVQARADRLGSFA